MPFYDSIDPMLASIARIAIGSTVEVKSTLGKLHIHLNTAFLPRELARIVPKSVYTTKSIWLFIH